MMTRTPIYTITVEALRDGIQPARFVSERDGERLFVVEIVLEDVFRELGSLRLEKTALGESLLILGVDRIVEGIERREFDFDRDFQEMRIARSDLRQIARTA